MRLRVLVVAAVALAIGGTYATAAQAEPSSSITKQITDLNNQLEDVTEQDNKMNEDLGKTKAQEKQLTATLPAAKQAMETASAQMKTIAGAAYMDGNMSSM